VALEPAVHELLALLERVGYTRATAPEKVRVTARRALQHADLTVKHVEAFRGMVGRIQWALDHPGVPWSRDD
jgi:tRNA C32,U32 (ribose-2'-O)-methylase TrmJ